jgi:hypothetical protein
MPSVRFLRSVAVVWLTCQLAAVCVVALAMCCPNAEPGDLCPMHHAKPAESDCLMRAACAPTDSSLVSLATGLGLLPHFSTTFVPLQSLDTPSALTPSALARADRPVAPPPKS